MPSDAPDSDAAPAAWHAPALDWPVTTPVGPGLAGAIACSSHVGARNPETGAVTYRAVPVLQLAATRTFEEVACLLICGSLPAGEASAAGDPEADTSEWAAFRDALRAARELPDEVANIVRAPSLDTSPLRLLRAGVAAIGSLLAGNDDPPDITPAIAAARIGECAGLLMLLATHRASLRDGAATLPGIPHSMGLDSGLTIALGAGSGSRIQQLMPTLPWLCTMVADDGLEASTFAGMVVGSTRADPWSAVVATLGAFEGAVRRPLDAAAGRDQRIELLRMRLDPASDALQRAAARGLIDEAAVTSPSVLALAVAVLLDHGMDVDGEMALAVLALPRVVAMLARLCEYSSSEPRIFRPLGRYVGPPDRHTGPGEPGT
ncbi:MAG: citrate/2-methylcitrate synthase [Planctomycetota bacterium]